ncbi:serine/threonine protein kinase, CMGC group [Tulasnella sp. 403]|nr:serine/threonine protein kinase, CMGC group [Tulasnella sp. 403]
MTPATSTPTPTTLAASPRPIPPPSNASLYPFQHLQRPEQRPIPKVNLAEEEDAADYRPGGYHPVHIMDTFSDGRYLVLRKMGWGHFSTVWLAKDNHLNQHVALKIMKSSRRYTETALDEIKLLRAVQSANPGHQGYEHVVSFLDSFQHMGVHQQAHVCMTFEPLGENLLSLTQRCVKENKLAAAAFAKHRRSHLPSTPHRASGFAPLIDLAVPPVLVKSIAKQILLGIDYLHSECKLIHTDLKPENILVALEDVEEIVRMELEVFPTSESIKSGAASNQVYIFSSQPLSSPSRTPIGSLQNSPMDRLAMRMTSLGLTTSTSTEPKTAPPTGMELGTGSATIAPSPAVATATLSGSPSGVSAAALMASTRSGPPSQPKPSSNGAARSTNGSSAISAKSFRVVDLSDEEAGTASMSSSFNTSTTCSQPVTPTTELEPGSFTVTNPASGAEDDATFGTLPNGFKPLFSGVPKIIKTSTDVCTTDGNCGFGVRDISVCDDRTETDTVVGDLPSAREVTPMAGSSPAPVPSAPGMSLLTQTAPKSSSQNLAPPAPSERPNSESRPAQPPTASYPHVPPIRVKIADLGNATPISHHYTNDIQTRQYRSPEAILGMDTWDERVDVWSVACVVFELLTGEYLFNPKSRPGCWGKDDDHVAQIVELVGDGFSREMKLGGKWSREIWRSNGSLRNIHRLHYWPLGSVMTDKYDYKPEEAQLFASFMEPMLSVDWKKRISAKEMLNHPWLDS